MNKNKEKKPVDVYLLLVEVGRTEADGLPPSCDGAGVLCYASAGSETQAVHDTVEVLRQADMSPLEVTCHESRSERLEAGEVIGEDEMALMQQAEDENAVVVVQVTPFYPDDGEDDDA